MSEGTYAYAKAKERIKRAKLPVLEEAGLLNEDTIKHLQSLKDAYDPHPANRECPVCSRQIDNEPHDTCPECGASYCKWCDEPVGELPHECSERGETVSHCGEGGCFIPKEIDPEKPEEARFTDKWQRIVGREAGPNFRKAVKNGNAQEIAFLLGLDDDQAGYSPIKEYEKFRRQWLNDHPIYLYFGGQGGGKTTSFLRDLWEFPQEIAETEGMRVAGMVNSRSMAQEDDDIYFVKTMLEVIETYIELKKQGYDKVVFCIDEASSHLTSYGKHLGEVADLASFFRRARKLGIVLVFVGHRINDIAANVRDLENARYVHKPNKETVHIYNNYPEDNLDESTPDIELRGMQDSELDLESGEFHPWSWEGIDVWDEITQSDIVGPDDLERVYQEITGTQIEVDTGGETCRVCNRSVGIDPDGFCFEHSVDDLPNESERNTQVTFNDGLTQLAQNHAEIFP